MYIAPSCHLEAFIYQIMHSLPITVTTPPIPTIHEKDAIVEDSMANIPHNPSLNNVYLLLFHQKIHSSDWEAMTNIEDLNSVFPD